MEPKNEKAKKYTAFASGKETHFDELFPAHGLSIEEIAAMITEATLKEK